MNAIYIDGFDYFDIKIDLEQSSDIVKKVTGKSLSYSELSNGLKVTMEINTEACVVIVDFIFWRSSCRSHAIVNYFIVRFMIAVLAVF